MSRRKAQDKTAVAVRYTVALVALVVLAGALVTHTPGRTPLAPVRSPGAPTASGSGEPAEEVSSAIVVARGSFEGSITTLPSSRPRFRAPREEDDSPREPQRIPGRNRTTVAPARNQADPPLLSFDGLNFAAHGSGTPPDPHGDIGLNHYIASVNASIGIYAKSDGALVNDFSFDAFMTAAGMSGTCAGGNMGDPYVFFDRVSSRWFITDFAWQSYSGPFYECIAVSKTSSPVSGGWWTYAVAIPGNNMNDYPKFGAWSDGIYMTSNLFYQAGSFAGVEIDAFNRADLISNADPIRIQTKILSAAYWSLLPANDEFGTASVGSPQLFVSDDGGLRLWKWAIDWGNAASSVWSGPFNVTGGQAYDWPTSDVTQRGSAEKLDTLGDRLMSAAQWSNVNGTPALWISRSVDAGSQTAGIYWAEIRGIGGTSPTVFQDMHYSVAASNRWMPSLVVNTIGAMALVYSYADASTYPSLAYAGRTPTASPGSLDLGERSIMAGLSHAASGYSRWGDYFSASLDPADDCTIWLFGEYMSVAGGWNWTTRVAKVSLGPCMDAPSNSSAPSTPASSKLGAALVADGGTWSGSPSLAYSWHRCTAAGLATASIPVDCSAIAGQTSATYTPVLKDLQKRLRVKVVATNAGGGIFMYSAATDPVAQEPVNSKAAAVTGTSKVGSTLTASGGTWSATPSATLAYRWVRCTSAGVAAATLPGTCALIDDATLQSYVLSADNVNKYLRVRVTATNSAGSAVSFSKTTSLVAGSVPTNSVAPTAGASAGVGQLLNATSGTWSAVPTASYTYAWFSCRVSGAATARPSSCSEIKNATSASFTPTSNLIGKYIRVRVTAVNTAGSASYYSAATSAVSP